LSLGLGSHVTAYVHIVCCHLAEFIYRDGSALEAYHKENKVILTQCCSTGERKRKGAEAKSEWLRQGLMYTWRRLMYDARLPALKISSTELPPNEAIGSLLYVCKACAANIVSLFARQGEP
jgi:hypothetical protein